jgi:myo-inositol 2-dehydrogenase/D-chiro-inositol 1-dehydrogenase
VSKRDPVRIAIVGAGRMGRTHLAALRDSSEVVVAAVVEPLAEVRDELAATGMRTHARTEELLAAGQFDAALVAAPSDLHLELVSQLAAAGRPILCEKPCGLGAEETAEAIRAAETAGVVLQVGYWRRFVPQLVRLRGRVRAGDFGDLWLLSCWQWDAEPPSAAFRARSGGILLDMGVHEFDQIRWLSGEELDEVRALPNEATGDPDSAAVTARLSGGGVGFVSLGRRFPRGDCCWVELMGSDGHARSEFMCGADGATVFHDALVAQADAFASAVRGEPQRGATGEDALRAIEAAELAARSLALAAEP